MYCIERDCQAIGLLSQQYIQFPISSIVARLQTLAGSGDKAKRNPSIDPSSFASSWITTPPHPFFP
jgi:hypothetical protein